MRDHREGGLKSNKVPRICTLVADPGREPLEVIDRIQVLAQFGAGDFIFIERFDRIKPLLDLLFVDQGLLDPAPEHSPAHGGAGLIEDPEKGASLLLLPQRLNELKVADRGGVQNHEFLGVIGADRGDMGEVRLLRLKEIGKKGAGRIHRAGEFTKSQSFQGSDMEMVQQSLPAGYIPEVGGFHRLDQHAEPPLEILYVDPGHHEGFVADDFRRGDLEDLIREFSEIIRLRHQEFPGGNIRSRDPVPVFGSNDAHEEIVAGLVAGPDIHVGARGDHAGDLALHKAFGQLRILDLVADRNLLPLLDEAAHIGIQCVERHAAHRSPLGQAALLAGQGELEKL